MLSAESLVGKQIDQFSIEGFIARGAMGMVFRAFDSVLARTVALKLIPKPGGEELTDEEAACREEARKRLIQEAKAAGRLAHPNIVTIHSYGETPEFQYICMEYVSGKTLAQVLRSRGAVPEQEAIPIVEQILMALDAAGREGIIHRDIKPANIMITDDGRAKVMDFGIAKLPTLSMTITGMVLGTPYYMSPEQISGQKVDIRSDLFSLGTVCYEMLTGQKPFEGQNTATITYKIVQVEPVPPNVLKAGISPRMASIVSKALAKDPAGRYATPAEMLKDLRNVGCMPKAGEREEAGETVMDSTVYAPRAVQPAGVEEGKPAPHEPSASTEGTARKPGLKSILEGEPAVSEEPEPGTPGRPETSHSEKAKLPEHAESDREKGKEPARGNAGARIFAAVAVLAGIVGAVLLLKPSETPPPASVPPAASAPTTLPAVSPSSTAVPATRPPSPPAPATVAPSTTVPATKPPAVQPPSLPAESSIDSMLLEAGRQFVNNPGGAQTILEEVLSRQPDHYDATLLLARLLTFRKEYGKAVLQYRKAIRLNGRAPELHFELGSILFSQANYDAAIQSFETCLTLSPLNRDEVLASLGFCYMQKNNPEKARSLLQKALELNPGNQSARSFLMSLPPAGSPPSTQPKPPQRAQPPAAALPSIEGKYAIDGTNPSGTKYRGTVTIKRSGTGFAFEWLIAKKTTTGFGVLSGNTLSVSYKLSNGTTGSAIYTVSPDGVLRGLWGANAKGTEVLTPVK
ncbi:MAG: protein kinase [Syntrophobacteraceae bacterium]